jgi:hypothetical protein
MLNAGRAEANSEESGVAAKRIDLVKTETPRGRMLGGRPSPQSLFVDAKYFLVSPGPKIDH